MRRRVGQAVSAILIAGVQSPGAASAQAVAVTDAPKADATTAYQGVCPGTDHPPAVAPSGGAGNVITWPGFQMLPTGGSRVFIQSTGPLTTGTHTSGNMFYIGLGSARLAHANNGRPLMTHYFNTPVEEAFIEIRGGQATLVLKLRARVQPTIRTEQVAATGYHFVYVDFPPGQYIAGAPQVSTVGPTKTLPPRSPSASAPSHLEGDVAATGGASAAASASGSATTEGGSIKAKGKAKGKLSVGF